MDAEYISGFAKDDLLKAMLTIVIYYGEEPWTGPTCLKDILDLESIPQELREKIVDYPIYIVDARRFEESEKLKTDARIMFGILQREKDWNTMSAYIDENKEVVKELSEEACDVLAAVIGADEFLEIKQSAKSKERKVNMCEAFRQMREEAAKEYLKKY